MHARLPLFMSATIMAPHLDAAHITSSLRTFCSIRAVQRIHLKTQQLEMPTTRTNRVSRGRHASKRTPCTIANEFQDDLIDDGVRKGRKVAERSTVSARKAVMVTELHQSTRSFHISTADIR